MADAPVTEAVSMSPILSTLSEAINAAGLAETLDAEAELTVLAPIDSAFAKTDPAQMESMLADPSGSLSSILTYHVIAGRLSSSDLSEQGSAQTLLGEEVTFEMRDETLVVNGGAAAVLCMDLATANATVFLIDSVLIPSSFAAGDSASTATTETATGATTGTATGATTGTAVGDTTPTTGG